MGRVDQQGRSVFLFVTSRPDDGVISLPALDQTITNVRTLSPGTVGFNASGSKWSVDLRDVEAFQPAAVVELTIEGNALDVKPVDVNTQNR